MLLGAELSAAAVVTFVGVSGRIISEGLRVNCSGAAGCTLTSAGGSCTAGLGCAGFALGLGAGCSAEECPEGGAVLTGALRGCWTWAELGTTATATAASAACSASSASSGGCHDRRAESPCVAPCGTPDTSGSTGTGPVLCRLDGWLAAKGRLFEAGRALGGGLRGRLLLLSCFLGGVGVCFLRAGCEARLEPATNACPSLSPAVRLKNCWPDPDRIDPSQNSP